MPTRRPIASCVVDRGAGAFGLAEIAIALGVIGFVIVSLMGLVSVGLQSGKAAQEDMILSSLMRRTLTEIRARPYADLPALQTNAYDFLGNTNGEAYFEVEIRTLPATLPDADAAVRARRLVVSASWPVSAPVARRESKVLETHVAEY